MNALLIAGVVILGVWLERKLHARPRRAYRPSDDALSHAFRSDYER